MPNISILGSTGSIGCQALDVIEALGEGYQVSALTAGNNWRLLAEQARRFKPNLIVLANGEFSDELIKEVQDIPVKVKVGADAILEAATLSDVHQVIISLVGFSGFRPTLAALKAGKKVALANKESLVVGGELIAREVPAFREQIIPVDSEHSALFQCLNGENKHSVRRVLITASGGPFRGWSFDELSKVTPKMALKHPNWKMGSKITIDSATLMNKGFEVLEAHWLFGIDFNNIEVLVHPQSMVHSLVEFVDGSVMAQVAAPDMRLPIQYALTYPLRLDASFSRVNLTGETLNFYKPDVDVFPCLKYAYSAGKTGGTMPASMNGANEVAVDYFLNGKISFTAISKLIKKVMELHNIITGPNEKDILNADKWARETAIQIIREGDL